MYGTRRRKRKPPWPICSVVDNSGQAAHKLPKQPKTAQAWLNRVFIHRGGARDFLIRYRQALRRVEVGRTKRPRLAAALLDVITDQRNLYQAFQHLYEEGCVAGPDGITWERFRQGLNPTLKKLSNQLRVGSYVRRPEWVHPIPKLDGSERLLVLQLS